MSASNGSTSKLQAKLADSDTVENLLQILDKLEIASFALSAADGFLKRGEEIADNVSDTIADAKLGSSIKEKLGIPWDEDIDLSGVADTPPVPEPVEPETRGQTSTEQQGSPPEVDP